MKTGTPDLDAMLLPEARLIRERSLKMWPDRTPVEMVGRSPAMVTLLSRINRFSCFREPVLIRGESGTGKELVARAVYLLSDRRDAKFVDVNCPQHTEANMTVSELFGHVKGAFTGATADREGLFAAADGGMMFLDEIADFPVTTQVMLLRALAEGEFRRLGDSTVRRSSARVLAATNRALEELVVQREFRHDLYFRLNFFRLAVPPLRERGDDWLLIARRLLARLEARHGHQRTLHPETVAMLAAYPWPGNIRQLEAAMVQGYSNADGEEITPDDVSAALVWHDIIPTADAPAAGHQPAPAAPPSAAAPARESGEDSSTAPADCRAIYEQIISAGRSFWSAVREPFLARELNKAQVRAVVCRALTECEGNYKRVLRLFNLPESDYQKFMDFLRTHDLKEDVRGRKCKVSEYHA